MKVWQEDLLRTTQTNGSQKELFSGIEAASKALGFDHCAYGFRVPWPISNPKTMLENNYSSQWQARYVQSYLAVDPTVKHCQQSQKPIVWSEEVFAGSRQLWEDARAHGLAVGWAQSTIDAKGVGGMLTLARSHELLTQKELLAKEVQMRWLVSVAHFYLSKAMIEEATRPLLIDLTKREVEVLQWTADGKSAQEIADILNVTKHVIDFHIKNSIRKLNTANKTAAVVKAALLGLLN